MKTTHLARGATSLLAAALLGACASAPPQVLAPAAPASFKEDQRMASAGADGTRWHPARPADGAERGQWWLAFDDPALTALIGQAGAANPGLAVAAARVRQARAIAGVARAGQGVQLDLVAGARRARDTVPAAAPANSYQLGTAASYEVDLFGRVAAEVSAAGADAQAAQAAWRSVQLALQADVAQRYFSLRAADAELATLAQTVRLRDESVRINQRRHELGEAGEFDLMRARTELAAARAAHIGAGRQRALDEHALAVLLGQPAAAFTFAPHPLEAQALPLIPAGLPASLLERRPDIAQAERAMAAAHARSGAARSAMFPALTLNAGAGGASQRASQLLEWSSRSWVIGALMAVPLLDGGRNRAVVEASDAVLEQAAASYRQSVLTAFAEVEDNLAGLRVLGDQAAQLEEALVSARRAETLAKSLYGAGRSSYLELLDAQRNLAAFERDAVLLRGRRAVTTVALIRTLGGGWDTAPAAPR